MHLNDEQARSTLESFAIPLVRGAAVYSVDEAVIQAHEIGFPVRLSVQPTPKVRVKHIAHNETDLRNLAHDLLRLKVNGALATYIMVEAAIVADERLVIMLDVDPSAQCMKLTATFGETTSHEVINPLTGLLAFQARNIANTINLPRDYWQSFIDLTQRLYQCCAQVDALSLVLSDVLLLPHAHLLVENYKIDIDGNALYRHPQYSFNASTNAELGIQLHARAAGIHYTPLRGTIGCVVNGAGLGLATVDMLMVAGLRVACLLDLCSDLTSGKLSAALTILRHHHNLRAVCFNLFCARAGADVVAHDLAAVLNEHVPYVPLIVRLEGQNDHLARAILLENVTGDVIVVSSMSQAVMRLIAVLRQGILHGNPG